MRKLTDKKLQVMSNSHVELLKNIQNRDIHDWKERAFDLNIKDRLHRGCLEQEQEAPGNSGQIRKSVAWHSQKKKTMEALMGWQEATEKSDESENTCCARSRRLRTRSGSVGQ